MRLQWVLFSFLVLACADNDAPASVHRGNEMPHLMTNFRGWPSDVGQISVDAFFIADLFVPSSQSQDDIPPTWSDGSTLSVERRGAEIALSWPAALDDRSIGSYGVYVDGQLKRQTEAEERTTLLSLSASGVTYEITVIARDDAMNRSMPLTVQYQHLDREPPRWSESSEVIPTHLSDTSVALSWTPAMDNVGVVKYAISLNGEVLGRAAMTTTYVLSGLSPRTQYVASIDALDAAGLKTLETLSVEFETSDTLDPYGLRPHSFQQHNRGQLR